MRILHVTDFHANPGWFFWLNQNAARFDAVVCSGDLLDDFAPPSQKAVDAERITDFLVSFKTPLFVASGNHDGCLNLPAIAAANPRVRVDGADVIVAGFRFVCIGWRKTPHALPKPTVELPVILVSHQPPDGTPVSADGQGDWGGFDVRALVEQLPTHSVVLSGHVHRPTQWHARVNRAMALNPGCTNMSACAPRHIVLDLVKARAALSSSVDSAPSQVLLLRVHPSRSA